ncbi:penicillin-binding protein 2 [Paenibacillus sp. MWE-103]|uniref:Penicillin-binding protein 2 n=1 Tax=Paenibacillus artemisiicola TaxID=1172618 RepID=A0ABS3WJE5_9BACL|nr:penicillin-binding transpeptidase domain-containing protein [Paenibacillus artemisiicola]MBO7748240.1 penicillin-binding protein 2 [Paenibacillus artemisiicola]
MSKEWRRKRQRRVFHALLGMSLLLAGMLLRLAWLQLAPAKTASAESSHWKTESVAQRERELVLDSGRGDFVDRHGLTLTGETYEALAVFPMQAKARPAGDPADLTRLAASLGVPEERLDRWMKSLKEPAFWRAEGAGRPLKLTAKQVEVMRRLRLNGVRVLPYRNRYPDGFRAKHALGYVSQHPELLRLDYALRLRERTMKLTDLTGGAGLERSLDALLQGTGPTTVSYFTDGADKPMHGLEWRLKRPTNPFYPIKVRTTLDRTVQNRLEAYVDKEGLREGAVVVLDADTADVVAMISRTGTAPGRGAGAGTEDYVNRAVRAATPGSIFKLVTEAAALEAHAVDERELFHCGGDYGRYGLHCWKRGGHGNLTLQDALAGSCNVAFATLAERLDARQLYVTAEKLGIGEQVGWASAAPFAPLDKPLRLLPEEEGGHVFAALPTVRDGGQLAQTGIGQRDVRLSPLQAANLVVTLLHGGLVQEPRLASEIRYGTGQLLARIPRQAWPSRYGQVSRKTTETILRGMEAVVAYGTGRSIAEGRWPVAGKSGTAQVMQGGTERLNQWFVGYGPVRSPRYAVAVLAENRGVRTPNQATRLFRGVMDILAAPGQ